MMAAPDFPASPTVGQIYTAPSGTVYKWDGAVWYTAGVPQGAYWTDTGTALTPTDATKTVAILDTPSHNALLLGSLTAKAHLITHPSADGGFWGFNQGLNPGATAWVQDDTGKPSWMLGLSSTSDNFVVYRGAPGGAQAALLTLDNQSKLTLTNITASTDALIVQTPAQAAKVHFGPFGTYGWGLRSNVAIGPGTPALDNTGSPAWSMQVDSSDTWNLYRASATTGTPVFNRLFYVDPNGNLTLTGAIVRPNSQFTLANIWSVGLPASWNGSVSGTWVQVVAVSVSLTVGRWHLIWANPGWSVTGGMNSGQNFYIGYGYDGNIVNYSRFDTNSANAIGSIPGASCLIWAEGSRPTGAHTYSLWVWRSAGIAIQTQGDATGVLSVAEFA
jgi:hypothetical protein